MNEDKIRVERNKVTLNIGITFTIEGIYYIKTNFIKNEQKYSSQTNISRH